MNRNKKKAEERQQRQAEKQAKEEKQRAEEQKSYKTLFNVGVQHHWKIKHLTTTDSYNTPD